MMKQLLALTLVLAFASALVVPAMVFAQPAAEGSKSVPDPAIKTAGQLVGLVRVIGNWIFTIFVLIAVLFLVMAAFQFVTAGGNATAVTEARQKVLWAAVGILVALGARTIPAVVQDLIGVDAPVTF